MRTTCDAGQKTRGGWVASEKVVSTTKCPTNKTNIDQQRGLRIAAPVETIHHELEVGAINNIHYNLFGILHALKVHCHLCSGMVLTTTA